MATTSKRASRSLAGLCFVVLSGPLLNAQLNLLTVREAESLVEQVPEVKEAKQQGRCPDLSVSYFGGSTLLIQARGVCPDPDVQSTFISNYMVNRATGVVTRGEIPTPVSTEKMDLLRAELLKRAHNRSISQSEASCLALTAYKSTIDVHKKDESFGVEQIGRVEGSQMQFLAEHRLPGQHAMTSAFFTVDIVSTRVRDDGTGIDVTSAELGSLTEKLVALRFPPMLSTDAAVEVALQAPAITQLMSDCYSLFSTGSGTAEEMFIGISNKCPGGRQETGALASVNLRTGQIMDPKTLRDISSKESQLTAQKLLGEAMNARAKMRDEIAAECHGK